MTQSPKITVRCIGCKAKRMVDQQEARRLSETMSVPMCGCGMPMVAAQAA